MNQLLEKLKSLEPKHLYWILAGLIFLVFLADFFTLMRLQLGGITSFDKKIVQLKKDIGDLSTNKQRLDQFKTQLELAKKSRQDFDLMVHRKDEVPVVLQKISSAANEYGVKIGQLLPQPLEAKPLVENAEGKYYGMTIAIRARAGFHQLGRFITRLDKDHLFWQLDSLRISRDSIDSQKHDVRLDIRVLILEKNQS